MGLQTLKKVYKYEDLTKTTNELAYKTQQLKYSAAIAETFTSDCKVFVKKCTRSNIVLIKNEVQPIDIALLSTVSQTLNQGWGATADRRLVLKLILYGEYLPQLIINSLKPG